MYSFIISFIYKKNVNMFYLLYILKCTHNVTLYITIETLFVTTHNYLYSFWIMYTGINNLTSCVVGKGLGLTISIKT